MFVCPNKTYAMGLSSYQGHAKKPGENVPNLAMYFPAMMGPGTDAPPANWKRIDFGHYGMNPGLYDYNRNGLGWFTASQVEIPTKTIFIAENYDGDVAAEPVAGSGFSSNEAGMFWPYHGDTDHQGGIFVFFDGHAKWWSEWQAEATINNVKYYYWAMVKTPGTL